MSDRRRGRRSLARAGRPRAGASFLCGLTVWVAASNICAADTASGPKTLSATRTADRPTIDGDISETAWERAEVADGFTQVQPDEGRPPTERTEIRMLYDDSSLYVAARMHDNDGSQVVSRLTRRDREIESDYISIQIDSRHDHHTAYVFQLNAAGVQLDGQTLDDTRFTTRWDAVWEGAARVDGRGWSAEMRIPLRVLPFHAAEEQQWGLNIRRYISRKKELDMWVYIPRTAEADVSRAGHLTGMSRLEPKRTLEVRPYALVAVQGNTDLQRPLLGSLDVSNRQIYADFGIDSKIGISSALALDLSLNPDFGYVEADEVFLDLNRLEELLAEKRQFFLEGMDVFDMPLQMLYSRRIGQSALGLTRGSSLTDGASAYRITESAQASRLWIASKLSGELSERTALGAVAALSAAERVSVEDGDGGTQSLLVGPERAYLAIRGRHALSQASHVGAMATGVLRIGGDLFLAELNHDALAQGVDGQWQSEDGSWRVTAQGVLSERVAADSYRTAEGTACEPSEAGCRPITRLDGTRLASGDVGWGALVAARQSTAHWGWSGEYRAYSPTLDINAMGYLPEFNRHIAALGGSYRETRPGDVLRSYSVELKGSTSIDFSGVTSLRQLKLFSELEYKDFTRQSLAIINSFGGEWDMFETGDGARLQRPRGLGGSMAVDGDTRGRFAWRGDMFAYWDYSAGGHGSTVTGELSLQLPRLEVSVAPSIGYDENALRFVDCTDAGGACTIDSTLRDYRFAELDTGFIALTLRGIYTLSNRLSLQGYTQLFMAKGGFSSYREISTEGTRPYIRRSRLRGIPFDGDQDGDGVDDDDFQQSSWNANMTMRWELSPGSVLSIIYTRQQAAPVLLAGQRPQFRLDGLLDAEAQDLFLIKLLLLWV